jgi:hypothetical protein
LLAKPTPRNLNLGSDRFAMFNKKWDIPGLLFVCRPPRAGSGSSEGRPHKQLPKPLIGATYLKYEATWRSGYATVCKF